MDGILAAQRNFLKTFSKSIVPDTPVQIRSATPDDIAELAAMAAQAFRDTYGDTDDPAEIEDYVTTQLTPAYFATHVASPESSVLLATCSGELLGYAVVTQSLPPECVRGESPVELARFYLHRDAKGKGHGAVLMRAVHAAARRFGATTIWLGVYDRNARAREFYRRWGFVDVGTKDFLFGGRIYADPVMCGPVPAET